MTKELAEDWLAGNRSTTVCNILQPECSYSSFPSFSSFSHHSILGVLTITNVHQNYIFMLTLWTYVHLKFYLRIVKSHSRTTALNISANNSKMEILCDSNHFLTVKIRPIAFLPQHGFSRLRHDTETPFVSQEEVVWNQRLLNKSIARKRQN